MKMTLKIGLLVLTLVLSLLNVQAQNGAVTTLGKADSLVKTPTPDATKLTEIHGLQAMVKFQKALRLQSDLRLAQQKAIDQALKTPEVVAAQAKFDAAAADYNNTVAGIKTVEKLPEAAAIMPDADTEVITVRQPAAEEKAKK
jgi:hypothetical protein